MLNFENVIAIIFHICFQFFIKINFECYNLLIDWVPLIIKYTERKKIWSKCYLIISNFLKTLVLLLSFWTEYGYGCVRVRRVSMATGASLISLHWKFRELISWILVTPMAIFRLAAFAELQD